MSKRRFRPQGYLAGVALVALVTGFGLITHGLIAATNRVMLFLLDDATRSELIGDTASETDRLNRLVSNVLDMARVEAGALKVAAAPGDIAEVVGAALERRADALDGRPVTLDVPRDLPPVLMSEPLVAQVLVCLLDNALKYSPPDSAIEVAVSVAGPVVSVPVADCGVGFPAGDERRIFDKFYRVERPGRVSGTGLGLAIARGVVEALGGEIRAEHRAGGGSIFRFMLPVAAEEP